MDFGGLEATLSLESVTEDSERLNLGIRVSAFHAPFEVKMSMTWSLMNSPQKLSGLFPDDIIPAFLSAERISLEMRDDDIDEVFDSTNAVCALGLSVAYSAAMWPFGVNDSDSPKFFDLNKNISIIGPKSNAEDNVQPPKMSPPVILRDTQSETCFSIRETVQPVTKSVAIRDRLRGSHDVILVEGLLWLEPAGVPPPVRLASFYQKVRV